MSNIIIGDSPDMFTSRFEAGPTNRLPDLQSSSGSRHTGAVFAGIIAPFWTTTSGFGYFFPALAESVFAIEDTESKRILTVYEGDRALRLKLMMGKEEGAS